MHSKFLSQILFLGFVLGLVCCKHKSQSPIPDLVDEPEILDVKYVDLPELAPAYGIVRSGMIQVNIEADDAPKVAAGQAAIAYEVPEHHPIACSVQRVLRGVSYETGQAVAWLRSNSPLKEGDFLYANITLGLKHHVIGVPWSAVFIRESKPWVILSVKEDEFKPTEVELGSATDSLVEITKGLNEGDQIVVQGGIGFLYPDFKASAEEE